MSKRIRIALWIAVGVLATCVYLVAANTQRKTLNLSATAGGQFPYLQNARRMAQEGVLRYFGDRNRTPLYPAALSLVHVADWDRFVARAAWFAIVSSLIFVGVVAYISTRLLSPLSALLTVVVTAFLLFLDRASFVQAELLYYTLFLAAWVMMCAVLRRPSPASGALAGILAGLAYLAKASALPLIVLYLIAASFGGVWLIVVGLRRGNTNSSGPGAHGRRLLVATLLTAACFFAVVSPYLRDNQQRFGRLFYNVNSAFFVWCDSWQEAKSFAERYDIGRQFPEAPPDQTPSFRRYRGTHSLAEGLHRVASGCRVLASQCIHDPAFRYAALTVVVSFFLRLYLFRRGCTPSRHALLMAGFCALVAATYFLGYAWYAQVAYGVRFVRSLYLPALVGALWLLERAPAGMGDVRFLGKSLPAMGLLAAIMLPVAVVEAAVAAAGVGEPGRAYVQFYFNESEDRIQAGDLAEGGKGMKGVLALRAEFAPAMRALGYLALREGDFETAIVQLQKSITIEPDVADAHNSLGSALIQSGRLREAIGGFRRATLLDSTHASAWFNLGGALWKAGRAAEARQIARRLQAIDPRLADQLSGLLRDDRG